MRLALNNSKQTKRKRKKVKINDLWKSFDNENVDSSKKLELVYDNQKVSMRENCELCNSPLAYVENKLLTCTNNKCGVIYKDVLDQTAEWRYYGADDSNMSDPTRCGMPINPLLKESSYGCKVVCGSKSSSICANALHLALSF